MHEQIAELQPALLRIARMQLRESAWAEDAVSETLVAALEGAATFASRSQLKTWVVGILKNKILDHFRRRQREVSLEAHADSLQFDTLDDFYDSTGHKASEPLNWGDPEAELSRTQFFEVLQQCIDNLPRSHARIFMMREWLELEIADVCHELGISPGNCYVMLHRARMRLRECVEINWFQTGNVCG
jgi:RNA polymerase sigma-70 factor (ECF subfamily)